MIGEPEQRLRLYRYRSIYNTFIIFLKLSQNTIICKSCRYNIHPNIHIFSKKIYWNLSKDVLTLFTILLFFYFYSRFEFLISPFCSDANTIMSIFLLFWQMHFIGNIILSNLVVLKQILYSFIFFLYWKLLKIE